MDTFAHPYILLSGFLILSALAARHISGRRGNPNGLPLPPGPKGYPIIGSLFDVPLDKSWLVYDAWSKKYGGIFHYKVLGTSFIVLGNLEQTNNLFEKRSSNYSDRVRLPMILELMHWGYTMTFLPYGQWWRRHRRLFHEHFHSGVVNQYQPIQYQEASRLLIRLLETPDNFLHHIRHTFAATIMSVAYGIQVRDSNDEYISTAEEALVGVVEAGVPGSFLVDLIPVLKYVPTWMPGAEFKRKAAKWSETNHTVETKPFFYIKNKIKSGEAVVSSITSKLIEKLPEETAENYIEEETLARHTAAVAYIGGADTTTSTLQFFFLAMAMYPEVQKKAQAEIDAVIGSDRLPSFSDRISLPYIDAMTKESMRWQMVVPLAVPHMCTNDDEYNGYYIPKGSVVIGNSWSILHDPATFSEPEEYNPERYLKDGKLNPNVPSPVVAFGYGRRICPGRHMSDNSLFIIMAMVLSVYNIEPPIDKQGNVIKLTVDITSGLLSYPVPFNCRITPRSAAAEFLIRQVVDEE